MIRTVKRPHMFFMPRVRIAGWRQSRRSGVKRLPRPGRDRERLRTGSAPQINRKLLVLALAYIAGMLIGVLVMRGAGEGLVKSVEASFSAYVAQRQSQPFGMTFLYALFSSLAFFVAAFICGICVVGAPGAFLIPCFKGLGLGLTTGYIYAVYGMKGMAFSALLLIPPNLVSALALLLACRESWGFSLMLFRGVLPGASALTLRGDFKMYCLRYLFILGILLLACLLDAGLSAAFIRFFRFSS
ncbi:MAG: hypothetical protein HFE86_06505 [Clostridiales bacterium]|nr:hypothetical protein [Clostridiales bacterium]